MFCTFLRDLHDGTWFRLDGGYLIETSLGSGQGCKFGAIIFNLMYCEAAPWCRMACKSDGTEFEESSYEMCDITYVDDECVCLDADSNDELLENP